MTMKVGVNGFGRIGRDFVREYFQGDVKDFEIGRASCRERV